MPTLIADYQVHPVTRALLHADFRRIDESDPVDVEVPLVLTGKSIGVTMGGKLNQVHRRLPVRCRPADIPVRLTHDITNVGLDAVVAVKDLELPEGVEVRFPPERTILGVYADKRRRDEKGEEEEEAAGA